MELLKIKTNSITVAEMHDISSQQQIPLLSDYNAPFWVKYTTDFRIYDKLFLRLYESFKYRSTMPTQADFTETVEAFLTANNKRYAELFRLEDISDEAYNILQNYDVTETMERDTSGNNTETRGAREDSDVLNMTGTNTHTSDGTVQNSYGEQKSTVTTSNPNIQTTEENTVAAFDADGYSPREKNTRIQEAHSIDTLNDINAHEDNETRNLTDTETRDLSDARTVKTGEQINKNESSANESYQLSRKGNIGVQTQSDMLMKHLELWDSYAFYTRIFADIADAFLLADYDCLVD